MDRKDIVKEIKRRVMAVSRSAEVILYGSEARGEATADSDIDVLILVDNDPLTLREEDTYTSPLYLLELETGVAISPLVLSKQAWANRPLVTPFYLNIRREGVRL